MVLDSSSLVSILVPTFNEGKALGDLARRLCVAMPNAEVWVIDAGDDGAKARVENFPGFHYRRQEPRRGKGAAIRMGVEQATRPILAQIDSDLQFYPEDLPALISPILAGEVDMVCGSRLMPTSVRQERSIPGARLIGNRAVSAYASLLSLHGFTDILAGIKAWRREVTASFSQDADDFCYEAELPIKAIRHGWRVGDVPVRTDPRRFGRSSVDVVRTGWALLRNIPGYRWGNP